jgi:molecular chaperone GrpE
VEMKQQKKRDKITDEYSRLRADFDNYRKNTENRIQSMRDYANMELIGQILDVVDNFELGIKAYKTAEGGDLDAFMGGMINIRKQLVDILKTEQVSPIKCKGEEFDPFVHEAISKVESEEHEDNIIVEVSKRGYMYKDKVLRPAKVIINQYPEY